MSNNTLSLHSNMKPLLTVKKGYLYLNYRSVEIFKNYNIRNPNIKAVNVISMINDVVKMYISSIYNIANTNKISLDNRSYKETLEREKILDEVDYVESYQHMIHNFRTPLSYSDLSSSNIFFTASENFRRVFPNLKIAVIPRYNILGWNMKNMQTLKGKVLLWKTYSILEKKR